MRKPTANIVRTSDRANRSRLGSVLACLILSLYPSVVAGQNEKGVQKSASPEWADFIDAFEVSDSTPYSAGGVFYHLVSHHLRANERAIFSRYVYEFQSQVGLEDNSTLVWNFNPEFETLDLHWIRVFRDGQWIDVLPTLALEVVDARTDVSSWFYDDSKDVRAILEDVRVGDVLDYAFTIRGSNPVTKDYYSESVSLGYSVPVGEIRVRFDWPLGNEALRYKTFPELIEPEVREEGDQKTFLWNLVDVAPVIVEDQLPSGTEVLPWVQFSDWPDWSAVADWAVELYPLDSDLPLFLESKRKSILTEGGTPMEMATKALTFVQDSIRYVSIPIGPHSYKPYPPKRIAERRYGDCKDKSLLTVLLLRGLGLEAWPVLVDSVDRSLVVDRLPTPASFDHVVVLAMIEGEEVWMDPTNSHQGGVLPERFFSDYSFGLVVGDETTGLISDVGPQGEEFSRSTIQEQFSLASFSGPVEFKVVSEYFGEEADSLRWNLADDGLDSFARSYLNYYAELYDRIPDSEPLLVKDEREENILTIEETYRFDTLFPDEAGSTTVTNFPAEVIRDNLAYPPERIRSSAFSLPRPLNLEHKIEIQIPDQSEFEDEDFSVENEWFLYEGNVRQEGNLLILSHRYENQLDFVLNEDLDRYVEDLNVVDGWLDYYIEVNQDSSASGNETPSSFFAALRDTFSTPVENAEAEAKVSWTNQGYISGSHAVAFCMISFLGGMLFFRMIRGKAS
ncbi:MAG: DUF3857 domain-containing protein [Verrucomicrobiota bacterium]